MADGLSLAVNILAVIQLTAQVASLSYEYINGVRRAPETLKSFNKELKSLTTVLSNLQVFEQENPGLAASWQLNEPLERCKLDMSKLKLELEPKKKWGMPISRLQWPFKEKETLGFIERIEKLKTLFLLAMSADQQSQLRGIGAGVRDIIQAQNSDRQKRYIGQIDKERMKVLNWLYPEAFDKRHIEISGRRQKDTGQWILREPEVQNWDSGVSGSRLLWGYGIPGAGKTFLSSLIIDYLKGRASTARSSYGIAYIYFNYNEQLQQGPARVLASLVKQLACQIHHLPPEVEDLYGNMSSKQENPSFESLYAMLLVVAKLFTPGKIFIICDALDECDQEAQRKDLLPLFHRMADDGVKLFLTSREYPEDIQVSFKDSAKVRLWAKDEDITFYIEQKIAENPRAHRLVQQGNCKDKIITRLKECANGMFLMVSFHIKYLCQQTTVKQILIELERLRGSSSKDHPMDPTYNRVMDTIRSQHESCTELASRVLFWLVKAQRALTVRELQLAVSVEESCTTFDKLALPDRKTLLDVCAGLVTIDTERDLREGGDTVKKDTERDTREEDTVKKDIEKKIDALWATDEEDTDEENTDRGDSEDGYIDEEDPDEEDRGGREDTIRLAHYTIQEYLLRNSIIPNNTDFKLAMACTTFLSYDVFTQGACASESSLRCRWVLYPFQKYAAWHLLSHLRTCDEALTTELILRFLESPGNLSSYVQSFKLLSGIQHCKQWTALHFAASLGHKKVTELLLEKGADISAVDSGGCTALHYAVGSDQVARLLLEKGADISATDKDGRTALHVSAALGHEPAVKLLLEKGTNTSAKDGGGRTALYIAASRGHEPIVKLLLEGGADITAVTEESTAIHIAALRGHEKVVKLLLEKGASMAGVNGGPPVLQVATLGGHEPIVRILFEKGADISATTLEGFTALHIAAGMGYKSITKLLLEKGADISAENENGDIPLHLAALKGHGPVVKLLLENGAETSATNQSKLTPLHVAAYEGHEPVVKLLLEGGADISVTDNYGDTPLHDAASEGHELVVKLLLEKGADISAANKDKYTVLHLAASKGHESVFKILLEKDAEIPAMGRDGETTLHAAPPRGYESVVKLLSEKGIDIPVGDEGGLKALFGAFSRDCKPTAGLSETITMT